MINIGIDICKNETTDPDGKAVLIVCKTSQLQFIPLANRHRIKETIADALTATLSIGTQIPNIYMEKLKRFIRRQSY